MKKVFILHGFEGTPNGAWRSWLMTELDKKDIYACSLAMPSPEAPLCDEWVQEIRRYVEMSKSDEIYLVGHSLGATAILRYLSTVEGNQIAGAILVAGPCMKTQNRKIDDFFKTDFDYEKIKEGAKKFAVIHGANDPWVPIVHAETTSRGLGCGLVSIENGVHLNGSSGWNALPQCLEALDEMMR